MSFYQEEKHYVQIDGEVHRVFFNQSAIDQILLATFVLAVISCILNLLLVISLCGNIKRTHLKFVMSLTFSDMILSVCHVVLKFRNFPSHWTQLEAPFKIQSFGSTFSPLQLDNNDFLGIIYSDMLDELLQRIPSKEPSSADMSISDYFTSIFNLTSSSGRLNNITAEYNDFIMEDGLKLSNVPDNIFASLYLIPSIISPLSIWLITISLLISVVKPLHVQIILSKCRGNAIVLLSWALACSVATVTFIFNFNKPEYKAHINIVNTNLLIWQVTSLGFTSIPPLYVVIIWKIHRRQFTNRASSKSDCKATLTALAITLKFIACNLPFIWVYVLGLETKQPELISAIIQTLFMFNTITDSLIYAIRLPEVREGLQKLLIKIKRMFA
jgi:hypothetical protein